MQIAPIKIASRALAYVVLVHVRRFFHCTTVDTQEFDDPMRNKYFGKFKISATFLVITRISRRYFTRTQIYYFLNIPRVFIYVAMRDKYFDPRRI